MAASGLAESSILVSSGASSSASCGGSLSSSASSSGKKMIDSRWASAAWGNKGGICHEEIAQQISFRFERKRWANMVETGRTEKSG